MSQNLNLRVAKISLLNGQNMLYKFIEHKRKGLAPGIIEC